METKVTKKGKEADLFFNYYKPISLPNFLNSLIKEKDSFLRKILILQL